MSPQLFAIVTNVSYALAGVAVLASGGEHRAWMGVALFGLAVASAYFHAVEEAPSDVRSVGRVLDEVAIYWTFTALALIALGWTTWPWFLGTWAIFTLGALVLPSLYAVPAVAAVALVALVLQQKVLFVIGTVALYAEAYALWKMTDPTSYRHGFWHVLTAGGIFTTYYGLVLVG